MERLQPIHCEILGSGHDVALVHGWGMHGGVWREFATRLAGQFRVHLIDLPGHGRSGMIENYTLDGLAQSLSEVVPVRAHWLGWSLGAMISLKVARRYPDRVASLVLMAGNACFSRRADWPCAMEAELLARFAGDLMGNYHATLIKFLGLQTWGLENSRALMKLLRQRIDQYDLPDPAALRAGLTILQQEDLRAELSALGQPLLLLMGGKDRLVPAEAGACMQELTAYAELQVLAGAAHVPFLTHEQTCITHLEDFWSRCE